MTTTFEIKHEGTKTGIVVQVDGVDSGQQARALLETAFDLAGGMHDADVTLPGWWAVVIGWAATGYGRAKVQRVVERSARNVIVQPERTKLWEPWADWPMVKLSPTGPWLDLRGETALRRGPGRLELERYRRDAGVDSSLEQLASMFELGVLEWNPGDVKPGHRRGIRRAT